MADSFAKTLKRVYVKLANRPDSKTVMAQLKDWFDDYISPSQCTWLLAANAVQGETIGNLNISTVLDYRAKTTIIHRAISMLGFDLIKMEWY